MAWFLKEKFKEIILQKKALFIGVVYIQKLRDFNPLNQSFKIYNKCIFNCFKDCLDFGRRFNTGLLYKIIFNRLCKSFLRISSLLYDFSAPKWGFGYALLVIHAVLVLVINIVAHNAFCINIVFYIYILSL
jgi:hypothetical protein